MLNKLMSNYFEASIHFSNLAYYSEKWVSQQLKFMKDIDEYEMESLNFLKKYNLRPKINNKKNLGLPNILYCLHKDVLFLSFPGIRTNQDKKNCLDFEYIENKYLDCQVHRGFQNIFLKLKDEVKLIIDIYLESKNVKEIYFVGHSLGGAIAKINALYFSILFEDVKISSITFASPIIGDKKFYIDLDKKLNFSFTLCCQKDFLIRIPMWRGCYDHNKYMIDGKNMSKYKNRCNLYLYNFVTFNTDTHKLLHYMNFLKENDFNLI